MSVHTEACSATLISPLAGTESAPLFLIVHVNQSIMCRLFWIECVCVYEYVQVWAAFWGMSPELCSGLAIHCPPLHNGQNHTTMRLDHGRIPGMLNYRARHSPLPLTENAHTSLAPHLLFPTPGSDGRNNLREMETESKGRRYR